MRDEVLEPLGMRSSAWHSSEVPTANLATGYRAENGKLEPEPTDDDGVFAAAGGLYTFCAEVE